MLSEPVILFSIPCYFFFFNDTATTEIYTLSLHDALPIAQPPYLPLFDFTEGWAAVKAARSEEHTSELQSRRDIVCRLLLEKKKKINTSYLPTPKSSSKARLRLMFETS